jgi:hypothetical protein
VTKFHTMKLYDWYNRKYYWRKFYIPFYCSNWRIFKSIFLINSTRSTIYFLNYKNSYVKHIKEISWGPIAEQKKIFQKESQKDTLQLIITKKKKTHTHTHTTVLIPVRWEPSAFVFRQKYNSSILHSTWPP